MHAVDVIEDPRTAAVALEPTRSRLLGELADEPASAAALAARVGLPRQKVHYHLRALEECGLVELAEVRRHGGLSERVLRATAASYVVSPAAIAERGTRPDTIADRLSADYLIALAGRVVREVGALVRRTHSERRRLPTFTLDTDIGFRTAADRAAFADELTATVLDLVARYHDDGGRPYRLVVAAHPRPSGEQPAPDRSPPTIDPEEQP